MRRRVADAEVAEQADEKRKKEFAKNFEATRQKRTDVRNYRFHFKEQFPR